MPKSLRELKTIISRDVQKQAEYIELFKNSSNPQVVRLHIAATARKEALDDVLRYIDRGCKVGFHR